MKLRKINRARTKLGTKWWHWVLLFCVLGVIAFGIVLMLS